MMRSILASLTSPRGPCILLPASFAVPVSFLGAQRFAPFSCRSAKSDPKFCCVRPNRIDRGRHPVARNGALRLTLNDEPASVYVALRQRDLFVPCHECDP